MINGGIMIPTGPGGASPAVRTQGGENDSETTTTKKTDVKRRESFSNLTFDYKGKTLRVKEPTLKEIDDGITLMSFKFSGTIPRKVVKKKKPSKDGSGESSNKND
jgi:hypothetical protein